MTRFTKKIGALAAALMIAFCAGCNSDKTSDNSTSSETSDSRSENASNSGTESTSENNDSSASGTESTSGNNDSSAPATPSEPREWHDLSQSEITEAMGMGWNLGNQMEAIRGNTPDETGWGNPVIREELLKLVSEQGFKTVRIPVSYLTHIGEGPDYTVEAAWLDRVQEVVDYVIDNGMFAIINMHGDGYYTIDGAWLLCAEPADKQTEIKAKYEAVWRQIADRFKDYDEHLIFESMNEEFDNTYNNPNPEYYSNINDYNQIFTDTVRKTGSNNTKRWLLMPGWNTNIMYTIGDFGFQVPEDTLCEADGKRIMISVHYYDPYNFTLNEDENTFKTQWGKYGVENVEKTGNEAYVNAIFTKLENKFVAEGYPVVIGELGTQDKSKADPANNEFRRYWLEVVVSAAKQHGCIPVYWDNGYILNKGFGVIDRVSIKVTQPELIAAMIRAINADGEYEIAAPAGFEKDDAA